MTIQFQCSACKAPLSAPDEMAGRKAKCRQCGGAVQVPNPAADRWPPGMAPPSLSPQAPSAKKEPRPTPAPPARMPAKAAHTAKVSPPSQSSAPLAPVKVATAVSVVPTTAPKKQVPPPLAVPVAIPLDSLAGPAPTVAPLGDDSGPSPLDEIAAMLDFEKSTPKAPSATPIDINPYASPSVQSVDSNRATVTPGKLRVRTALQEAWRLFRANFSDCVAAVFCAVMSVAVAVGITSMLIRAYGDITQGTVLVFGMVLFWPVLISVPAWIGAGMCKFAIEVVQGRDVVFQTIYAGRPYLLPTLAVVLVQTLFFALSTVATLTLYPEWLGFPVLLPAVFFWQAPFLAMDRKLGAIAALFESARLTAVNLPRLTLIWLIAFSVTLPLVLITCGLGLVLIAPFWLVLHAVTYVAMTQRAAESAARSPAT